MTTPPRIFPMVREERTMEYVARCPDCSAVIASITCERVAAMRRAGLPFNGLAGAVHECQGVTVEP